MRRPEELLYDSEACLRLIDHVIEELGSSRTEATAFASVCAVSELAAKPAEGGAADRPSIGGRAHHSMTR
jgi:hypothetical protein